MNRAVSAALNLKQELENYGVHKDRTVLIRAFRDQFLVTRGSAVVEVEKVRIAALEILLGRMAKMSDNMLLHTIEVLSEINAVDMAMVSKNAPPPLINLQQNLGISVGQGDSPNTNPVKAAGELIESLEHIANHFRNRDKIIDLKAEKDKQ